MRKLPNVISIMRIILSIYLLVVDPFMIQFWCIYIICGLSDVADGYLARKFNASNKLGAILDSLGDIVLAAIVVNLVILHVKLPSWSFFWIAGIVVIKLLTILIGFLKFRAFVALHTYANKVVGLLLYIGLPIYIIFYNGALMVFLLLTATIAAVEEMLIVIKVERLERDAKSIFK